MNHIKSIALSAIGILVALATLGFFASVGLAVLGALVTLGLFAAIAAGLASLLPNRDSETAQQTVEA